MKTLYVFALFSSVWMTYCTSNGKEIKKDPQTEVTVPLQDIYWKLVELNGQPVTNPPSNQKEAYIQLITADKRAVGSGGCNSLSGSYELKEGHRLTFTNVASTRMACPDMSLEAGLNEAINMTDHYAIHGQYLSLHKAKMSPVAKFEAINK